MFLRGFIYDGILTKPGRFAAKRLGTTPFPASDQYLRDVCRRCRVRRSSRMGAWTACSCEPWLGYDTGGAEHGGVVRAVCRRDFSPHPSPEEPRIVLDRRVHQCRGSADRYVPVRFVLFRAYNQRSEHLGFNIVNKPGELPVGHMSPVTAFCFLLSSLSYLLSLPSSRDQALAGQHRLVACLLHNRDRLYSRSGVSLWNADALRQRLHPSGSADQHGVHGSWDRTACSGGAPCLAVPPECRIHDTRRIHVPPGFRPSRGGHCDRGVSVLPELRNTPPDRGGTPAFRHCRSESGRTCSLAKRADGGCLALLSK